MASYEQVLEYVTTPSTTEPTTLISAFSDSRIVSTFIVSNVGSSSANVSMAIYDGSDNKLVSILSNYSIGIGKSQTLNVNSLNLPATYKVMVESDSEDVNFCASGVKVTATYTGDAEDVIEEYTEAAKAVIDQAVIDAEAQIDAYAEGYEDTITNFASTTLQPYADDAEASASAASDSETNAATSEANASASASSAATSESNAATSATNAATSEANTQALFDNFDSSVAESVGLAAIPYPDLHIPFNDGLRIESGYGTNDQIDVSAAQDGSVMVDLPSMSASYTSSSGTYYIDKSGQLVEASEVPITKEGVQLHSAFSNSITYSNFNGGYPLGTASTDWSDINSINGFTLAKFEGSIEFSDYSISGEDCFSFSCVVSTSGLVDSSDTIRLRVESRGETTAAVNCYIYDDLSVVMDSSNYFNLYTESLGDNLIRIHVLYDDTDGALLNTSARIAIYSASTDATSYPYYGEFQLSPGVYSILPIIKTESTSAAASATYVTFQQRNNVLVGEANSLVMDIVTSGSSAASSIFRAYTDSRIYAYAQNDEITLVWYTASNIEQSLTCSGVTPLEKHRVCFINSLDNLYIAVDGEVKASLSITSSVNFRNISNFQLGVHTFAPSCVPFISDFKIYHSALTADQVKALGAAE